MSTPSTPEFEPLDEKLSRVTFLPAPEPHIRLDPEICRKCRIDRVCLTICPAGNFRLDERTRRVSISTESCLECGACRIVCTEDSVSWRWPQGGFGVCYTVG